MSAAIIGAVSVVSGLASRSRSATTSRPVETATLQRIFGSSYELKVHFNLQDGDELNVPECMAYISAYRAGTAKENLK